MKEVGTTDANKSEAEKSSDGPTLGPKTGLEITNDPSKPLGESVGPAKSPGHELGGEVKGAHFETSDKSNKTIEVPVKEPNKTYWEGPLSGVDELLGPDPPEPIVGNVV